MEIICLKKRKTITTSSAVLVRVKGWIKMANQCWDNTDQFQIDSHIPIELHCLTSLHMFPICFNFFIQFGGNWKKNNILVEKLIELGQIMPSIAVKSSGESDERKSRLNKHKMSRDERKSAEPVLRSAKLFPVLLIFRSFSRLFRSSGSPFWVKFLIFCLIYKCREGLKNCWH